MNKDLALLLKSASTLSSARAYRTEMKNAMTILGALGGAAFGTAGTTLASDERDPLEAYIGAGVGALAGGIAARKSFKILLKKNPHLKQVMNHLGEFADKGNPFWDNYKYLKGQELKDAAQKLVDETGKSQEVENFVGKVYHASENKFAEMAKGLSLPLYSRVIASLSLAGALAGATVPLPIAMLKRKILEKKIRENTSKHTK